MENLLPLSEVSRKKHHLDSHWGRRRVGLVAPIMTLSFLSFATSSGFSAMASSIQNFPLLVLMVESISGV